MQAQAPFTFFPIAKELQRRMYCTSEPVFQDEADLEHVFKLLLYHGGISSSVGGSPRLCDDNGLRWLKIQRLRNCMQTETSEEVMVDHFRRLCSGLQMKDNNDDDAEVVATLILYLVVWIHETKKRGGCLFWSRSVEEVETWLQQAAHTGRYRVLDYHQEVLARPYLNILFAAVKRAEISNVLLVMKALSVLFRNNHWSLDAASSSSSSCSSDFVQQLVKDFHESCLSDLPAIFSFLYIASSFCVVADQM